MRVLIAEDDPVSGRKLLGALRRWGYEVEDVRDGEATWRTLQARDAPPLAVINWMMPGMDGVELCRRYRQKPSPHPVYIILLTARDRKDDIVLGLQAGRR